MARPLRIEIAGGCYHIMSRGIQGTDIFLDPRDREKLLLLLNQAHKKYHCLFYAYSLLPNHYHLLIQIQKENLSQIMHFINVSYSVYFNTKHVRSGHLFQGRYKSIFVDKESYLLELSRYIHLNVVHAAIKNKMNNYRWSSFTYYMNPDKKPVWLCIDWLLDRFGKDWATAKKAYSQFIEEGIRENFPNPLAKVYKSTILGNQPFIDATKQRVKDRVARDREIPGYKSISRTHSANDILQVVAQRFRMNPSQLCERQWKSLPRKLAIYMIRQYTDLKLEEIGKYFKVSYSAISQCVREIRSNNKAQGIISEIEKNLKSR
jgi:putative transposase